MTIYVNNQKIKTFNFPGGECHVSVSPSTIDDNTNILAKIFSANTIMELLLVVDAIRQIKPNTKIDLTIPYFPYGRQDRVCNAGESFSLEVMANLINQLNCQSITVYDPHSEVTIDALNNCQVVSLSNIICSSILPNKIKDDNILLVAPDKGAKDKVQQVGNALEQEVICASKVRDPITGNIVATAVNSEIVSRNYIILDDICDGGKTFIELAKVLKVKGANQLYLYVTHGIFSKGLEILKAHFKHIYCYHTMLNDDAIDPSFLTIFEN